MIEDDSHTSNEQQKMRDRNYKVGYKLMIEGGTKKWSGRQHVLGKF